MAQDERQVSPPDAEIATSAAATAAASHGIEIAVQFKPVEHPIEPLDNAQPVKCPLPEPSILNVSANSGSSNFSNWTILPMSQFS